MFTVVVSHDKALKGLRRALTIVGAFLLAQSGIGQSIEGKVGFNSKQSVLILEEVVGGNGYPIDTCDIQKGKYHFSLEGLPEGYYRIRLQENNRIDFIHHNGEIVIDLKDSILQNAVSVVRSEENKLLWNYKYYSRTAKQKEKKIIVEQSYLTKGEQDWIKLQEERDSIQVAKRTYLNSLCDSNPNTLFAKLVGATQREGYNTPDERKQHYFDNIDFSDPVIIRSSVLPPTIMGYFQSHTEYSEEGFQQSIEIILDHASANNEVYDFCLNFILDLFNRVGPDVVFQYAVEKYLLDGGCGNANISARFSELAEGYKAVMPGNIAPMFIAETVKGEIIVLEEYLKNGDYTVLFFFSSHCSFCEQATPQLKAWDQTKPNISLVAVSLDEQRVELERYVQEKGIEWDIVADFDGWDSNIVKQYKIHKTPSYYVLNAQGIIMAKPKTIDELVGLGLFND